MTDKGMLYDKKPIPFLKTTLIFTKNHPFRSLKRRFFSTKSINISVTELRLFNTGISAICQVCGTMNLAFIFKNTERELSNKQYKMSPEK